MSGPLLKAWGSYPVRWLNGHAIITLPEHIDPSTIGSIREQLLSIINRDVLVLVVDMSGTISCDDSGADALARVRHRALASGTELRLVVSSEIVRRVLSVSGVGRLMSVYPSVEAALAATQPAQTDLETRANRGRPGAAGGRRRRRGCPAGPGRRDRVGERSVGCFRSDEWR